MRNPKKVTNNSKKNGGYTLVETVMVIAIGGLIFMAVFIGWRYLRKEQQVAGLKHDVNLLAGAVNHCMTNNANIPTACDEPDEVIVNLEEFSQSKEYNYALPAYGQWAIIFVEGPVWLFNTACSPGSITAFDPPQYPRFTVSIWLDADRAGGRPSYCVPF